MAIPLTVNGVTFQYPEVGDEDWGQQATSWASAVTAVISIFTSATAPIADEGVIRLGTNDKICWRNTGDTDNACLFINGSDRLIYDDGIAEKDLGLTGASGNVQHLSASTDNALARFDGIMGTVIQNSGVLLDDSGNLSGIADIDATSGTIVTLDGTTATYTTYEGTTSNVVTLNPTTVDATNIDVVDLDINGSNFEDLIVNPAGAVTDNRLVRFDGVSGQDIQESGVTLNDTNDITGVNDLTTVNDITAGNNLTATSQLQFATVTEASANELIDTYTRPAGATVAARGVAISASNSGSFSTSGTTPTAVTNLTVTITTSGRPVVVQLISDNTSETPGSGAFISASSTDTSPNGSLSIRRDGNSIGTYDFGGEMTGSGATSTAVKTGPSACSSIDSPTAGTYTYTVFAYSSTGDTIQVEDVKLVAYEL